MVRPKRENLAVGMVGATGVVGQTFLQLLEERRFPFEKLVLFASDSSVGKKLKVKGAWHSVLSLSAGGFDSLDWVFFSSGEQISREWAPMAQARGAIVVDNSPAFRMDPDIPLVVPEVNGKELERIKGPAIIANPNCTAIQLVMVLGPLNHAFGLDQVSVATYQAVSGAGREAVNELRTQLAQSDLNQQSAFGNISAKPQVFPHPIAFNAIPQVGAITESGFCGEEVKIREETRKILNLPQLPVSAFTVRIPTLNVHAEAVWVRLKQKVAFKEILAVLQKSEGLICTQGEGDENSNYATPLSVNGRDEVFVSRLRCDPDDPYRWLLWIVSDNLRKGAATNGLQIAERLFFS